MFFHNLTLFRFDPALDLSRIDTALDDFRVKPVGPLEMSARGFVSPFGRGEDALTHRVGTGIWFAVGGEDKILPGAVVNEFTARKVAEIEEREGRRLGGRSRKRLKEEVLYELLPRAFTRPVRTDAHVDTEHGFIAIDTSSRKTAEGVLAELRQALGSFPALPLNAEATPRFVLTGWLSGDEPLPDGLTLGDECELRDPADHGAIVRCTRQEMESDEIEKHLEAGKQCSRLALTLDDHLSFVFGDDLVVRKLKFLDGAVESLENTERDSVRAELDARYALMVGELKRLFGVLETAFQLTAVDSRPMREPGPRPGVQARMDEFDWMAPASPHVIREPDALYDEARSIVIRERTASISGLQRRLKIGYNRAARLIETMELDGTVSPPRHDGSRTVLAEA